MFQLYINQKESSLTLSPQVHNSNNKASKLLYDHIPMHQTKQKKAKNSLPLYNYKPEIGNEKQKFSHSSRPTRHGRRRRRCGSACRCRRPPRASRTRPCPAPGSALTGTPIRGSLRRRRGCGRSRRRSWAEASSGRREVRPGLLRRRRRRRRRRRGIRESARGSRRPGFRRGCWPWLVVERESTCTEEREKVGSTWVLFFALFVCLVVFLFSVVLAECERERRIVSEERRKKERWLLWWLKMFRFTKTGLCLHEFTFPCHFLFPLYFHIDTSWN